MIYPKKLDLNAYNTDDAPRYLYHYTKFSSAVNILKTGKFLLRALEKMNDPHEYRLRQTSGVVFDGNPSFQECADIVHKHDDAIAERKNAVRIASFSIDKKPHWCILSERGWNRMSMWTYYAESHAGVCLIFNRKQLEKDYKNTFGAVGQCYCRQIQYVNECELNQYEEMFWKPNNSYLDEKNVDHLFVKANCYAPEQEYRLLLVNKDLKESTDIEFPIRNCICGIITGDKFDKSKNAAELQTAIETCNKDIRTFEMDYNMPDDPLYSRAERTEFINETLKNL
jgi:hypothetical protein